MQYAHSALVEAEYGLIGPLVFEQMHNGPDNDVFVVADSNGVKYALRQSKRAGKNIAFEIDILVALDKSNFSSPKILQTKSRKYFVEVDGAQLVLFEYIEGIKMEKDVTGLGARKFGQLHSLTNGLQLDVAPTRTIFTEFDRLLKIDQEKIKQFKDYETVVEQVKQFYKEAESKIASKKELYGIIHNDYRIQNLIYTTDDCYIIDFDWSCYGPLLKDLGLAIAEWSMYTRSTGASREAIDKFINSYNETAPRMVSYDKDLIFWICFACLSDTCTFLVDVAEGGNKHTDKVITDVDQCHMYKKFKYFYNELK